MLYNDIIKGFYVGLLSLKPGLHYQSFEGLHFSRICKCQTLIQFSQHFLFTNPSKSCIMKFVRLLQISILAKVNISEFDHGSNIVNCKYHNHSEFRVFERSFHILSFVYIQRLTVTVEYEDNPPVQVDVLDTDTIEQAKEKIMEVLFKVSHFMIRAYLRFVFY